MSTLPLFSILWFSSRALTISVIGLLGMICFPDVSSAETIYLKSGISISVTRAQEQDSQILYWVGEDQYSISKDAVARIEAGDAPVSRSAHAGSSTAGSGVQDLTRREPPNSGTHDKVKIHPPPVPNRTMRTGSGCATAS